MTIGDQDRTGGQNPSPQVAPLPTPPPPLGPLTRDAVRAKVVSLAPVLGWQAHPQARKMDGFKRRGTNSGRPSLPPQLGSSGCRCHWPQRRKAASACSHACCPCSGTEAAAVPASCLKLALFGSGSLPLPTPLPPGGVFVLHNNCSIQLVRRVLCCSRGSRSEGAGCAPAAGNKMQGFGETLQVAEVDREGGEWGGEHVDTRNHNAREPRVGAPGGEAERQEPAA